MKAFFNIRAALTALCLIATAFTAVAASTPQSPEQNAQPNIVFLFCDDLGYGDVQCLNPERGKIKTPHIDRLAAEGMTFTDAHSGSSVCTPTRYGLLTGRYSWRTWLQSGVVQGFAPNLISEGRLTVADLLRDRGYRTAIIGKWHLNFQYTDPDTGEVLKKKKAKGLAPVGSLIPDGPLARGFDYFHGFHHARDMRGVIENDRVIEHDETINMLPRLEQKAVEYIQAQKDAESAQPFFLYVPFGSPHTPIVPTPEWQGRSGLGAYADFVMQTDGAVGAIIDAIDDNGFADNTLVIFSSDNGCSKAAKISQLQAQGHYPSAHLRGSKADLWDGGHRIPFIARWSGEIEPGSESSQTICLTDFISTCAEIVKVPLPNDTAEDSVSFLPALKGKPVNSTRAGIIHHSFTGHFAYREGKWKLLLAKSSGGWTAPREEEAPADALPAQLYDLEADPGETNNLYESHPEIAERLLNHLEADVKRGRSTEGPTLKNDTDAINLWKSGRTI